MNEGKVQPEEPPKPAAPITVLLVDDEESVLRVTSRLMQRAGFKVLTASDGRVAIDLFRASKDEIHVVVVDLTLPGVNGETVCREIIGIKPGITVILASGYGADEVAARFSPGQIAGIVQKPYPHEALIALVHKARTSPRPTGC